MDKVYFINDGIVIANELLTLSEKIGKRDIDFDIHLEYVKALASYMSNKFNINFVVIPNQEGLEEWFKENGDFFEMIKKDEQWLVKLKDEIKPNILRRRFRAVLPYESLKAFIDNEPKLIKLISQKERNSKLREEIDNPNNETIKGL